MMRKVVLGMAVCVLMSASALAQTIRGQILLPNGEPAGKIIQFTLTSNDGMTNEVRFTDSHGRFILERLRNTTSYTVRVDGDGSTFDATEFTFTPQFTPNPRITLNAISRKSSSKDSSAGSAKVPVPAASAAEKRYEEARQAISREEYAVAEGLLRKIVEAEPKNAAALIDLGAVLMRQKKFAEAEKFLRAAIALDPRSAVAHLDLGITLNRQNRFAEAVTPLREALVLDPDSAAAHAHLGVALLETDKLQEAETHLLRGLKYGGTEEIICHMYLGNLYAKLRRYEDAIRNLEIYLERLPGAANAGEVRGLIEKVKKERDSRK